MTVRVEKMDCHADGVFAEFVRVIGILIIIQKTRAGISLVEPGA